MTNCVKILFLNSGVANANFLWMIFMVRVTRFKECLQCVFASSRVSCLFFLTGWSSCQYGIWCNIWARSIKKSFCFRVYEVATLIKLKQRYIGQQGNTTHFSLFTTYCFFSLYVFSRRRLHWLKKKTALRYWNWKRYLFCMPHINSFLELISHISFADIKYKNNHFWKSSSAYIKKRCLCEEFTAG